jgi:hypothetical protein
MKLRRLVACLATAVIAVPSAHALTINLVNTGGVTPGTAAYTGFAAAAYYWQSVLSDNVTVTFEVGFTSAGFDPTTLGSASSSSSDKTQTAWRNALIADATTALDAVATQHLAPFTSANVNLNTSLQKALDLYTGGANNVDASISFNSARPFDFDTRDGFATVSSDFVAVAVHEMGHALGFTSDVWQLSDSDSTPSNTDMFRYKDGALDFTWGGSPYFSIDGGATQLFGRSGFASGADGFQTSHWMEGTRIHDGISCTTLTQAQIGVMDPTGGLCQEGIVTAQDLAAFDAIGWNVNVDILNQPGYQMNTSQIMSAYLAAQVPEPSSWAMLVAGLGLTGVAWRRRRVTAP